MYIYIYIYSRLPYVVSQDPAMNRSNLILTHQKPGNHPNMWADTAETLVVQLLGDPPDPCDGRPMEPNTQFTLNGKPIWLAGKIHHIFNG